MKNSEALYKFVGDQISRWPLACENFRALKNVRVREINAGGLGVKLQFNPARMISSAAKLNKSDIAKRKCFLCRDNRPAEQIMLKFEGRKGKKYHILLNPYPIFPDHINHSRVLYDPPPRVMEIKARINKWDLIKFNGFFTKKETLRMVKR